MHHYQHLTQPVQAKDKSEAVKKAVKTRPTLQGMCLAKRISTLRLWFCKCSMLNIVNAHKLVYPNWKLGRKNVGHSRPVLGATMRVLAQCSKTKRAWPVKFSSDTTVIVCQCKNIIYNNIYTNVPSCVHYSLNMLHNLFIKTTASFDQRITNVFCVCGTSGVMYVNKKVIGPVTVTKQLNIKRKSNQNAASIYPI